MFVFVYLTVGAGFEDEWMLKGHVEELIGGPVLVRVCHHRVPEAFVVEVVVQPALHASEVSDGDLISGRYTGDVLGDRVVETHLALIDELQHRRHRERLGDAADPLEEVRAHGRAFGGVGDAERSHVVPAARPHPDDRPGDALLAHRLSDCSIEPARGAGLSAGGSALADAAGLPTTATRTTSDAASVLRRRRRFALAYTRTASSLPLIQQ